MHGSHLAFFYKQKLLCVGLRILIYLQIPVADRNKREAYLIEFAEAVVRDIPSEHIIPDLVVFRPLVLPVFCRPFAKRRYLESVRLYHFLHTSDLRINL